MCFTKEVENAPNVLGDSSVKKEATMKKKAVLKSIVYIFLAFLLAVIVFLGVLTIREYRPDAVEKLNVQSMEQTLEKGEVFTILSYNTGYAGLGKDEDFFMDGGKNVQPETKQMVETNLEGITNILKEEAADIYFLQEVDVHSKRSYYINQQKYYEDALNMPGNFACNFKCDFVPYPLPPIGKVTSGLVTMTEYKVTDASRIALPESFKWPIKTCNLKRCMLEERIPVQGTDKELVLINFHLEAYDSGKGKIAQSNMLAKKLKEEYEKGNYVIAGGDFNQTFEGMDTYPIHDQGSWVPGKVSADELEEGFSFAVSDNAPTCRLLNSSYSGNYEETQVYVIDGFIVSDNIEVVNVENIDTQFEFTDHQPVKLKVKLKE